MDLMCCFSYMSPLKEGQKEWYLKEILCIQNYFDSCQPGSLQEQNTDVKTLSNLTEADARGAFALAPEQKHMHPCW